MSTAIAQPVTVITLTDNRGDYVETLTALGHLDSDGVLAFVLANYNDALAPSDDRIDATELLDVREMWHEHAQRFVFA